MMKRQNSAMLTGFLVVMAFFVSISSGYAFNQWPDTGQTKCYNDTVEIPCPQPGEPFYGQDAQYAGPARSYTKLAHGDVELPDTATYDDGWIMTRDNVTGLIWEMKTDDGSIHDRDNTYTWCDTNPATNGGDAGTCGDGTDTEDFINAVNDENFGGHADWRLPTVKELSSLVNSNIPSPTIDIAYFPIPATAFPMSTLSLHYWSAIYTAYSTDLAWCVNFFDGYLSNYFKSSSCYVRVVRTGK